MTRENTREVHFRNKQKSSSSLSSPKETHVFRCQRVTSRQKKKNTPKHRIKVSLGNSQLPESRYALARKHFVFRFKMDIKHPSIETNKLPNNKHLDIIKFMILFELRIVCVGGSISMYALGNWVHHRKHSP